MISDQEEYAHLAPYNQGKIVEIMFGLTGNVEGHHRAGGGGGVQCTLEPHMSNISKQNIKHFLKVMSTMIKPGLQGQGLHGFSVSLLLARTFLSRKRKRKPKAQHPGRVCTTGGTIVCAKN